MESWGLSRWVCHSVTLGRFHVTIIIRSANTHSAQIQMNLVFVSKWFKTLTKVLSYWVNNNQTRVGWIEDNPLFVKFGVTHVTVDNFYIFWLTKICYFTCHRHYCSQIGQFCLNSKLCQIFKSQMPPTPNIQCKLDLFTKKKRVLLCRKI